VDTAAGELAGLRDRLEGRLAIGVFPTALAVLVPRALARLRAAHPALDVQIREGGTPTQLRRLRVGRIELATVAVGDGLEAYDLDGLDATAVVRHGRLLLAVGEHHRLAGRGSVDLADLEGETWVVGRGEDPQFGVWPELAQTAQIGFAVRDWPSRFGLVAAGLGIAIIPGILRDAVPPGIALATVDDRAQTRRDVLAVTRPDPSPGARALVDALREEGAALAARSKD
ncbi:MAG TPA: LysR substrate-binding domain-containing protein, partial [Baekduia sp.]